MPCRTSWHLSTVEGKAERALHYGRGEQLGIQQAGRGGGPAPPVGRTLGGGVSFAPDLGSSEGLASYLPTPPPALGSSSHLLQSLKLSSAALAFGQNF